ncbi:MAG: hypothetical protein ACOCSR_00305 [Wenzhouxiangella sp.]
MFRGLHNQPAFLVVTTGSLAALLYLQARTPGAAALRSLPFTQLTKEKDAMKKSDNCFRQRYLRALAQALASSVIPPMRLIEELKCSPCESRERCDE